MAGLGDAFKGGNLVTGLAIGLGFSVIGPMLKPVLRPAAKALLKGGIAAYDQARSAVAELNEQAGDVVAEARAEMEAGGATGNGSAELKERSRQSGKEQQSEHRT